MVLKNYTSSVSMSKSIAFIEQKLVQHGATQILKEYGPAGSTQSICFSLAIEGREIYFKLPARVAACEKILLGNLSSRARPETRTKTVLEQAARTAWKILSDWVEAQMAMIELAQVEMLEVFLPYVYDSAKKQTYFEAIKNNHYKALLPAPATNETKQGEKTKRIAG